MTKTKMKMRIMTSNKRLSQTHHTIDNHTDKDEDEDKDDETSGLLPLGPNNHNNK